MQFSPLFKDAVAKSKFVENLRNGLIEIDNSEFSTWGSCFTMGLYNGALKRVNARSRAPLAFGGAVHVGMEYFFKGKGVDECLAAAFADAAITGLDDLCDEKRNTTILENLLRSYFLEYPRNPEMHFNVLRLNDQLCVEQSFSIPLGEITVVFEGRTIQVTVMWMGKIDLLTSYENSIAPVDHKTTTVMGEKFVDDKVRSSQMLGYTYAARYLSETLFNKVPVWGVRINALAMRKAGFEFKQFDIPYPDWKVAEWQSETLIAIGDLVRSLDSFLTSAIAIPTREHCVTKYGRCPYFDVCDSVPSMRDRMMFDDEYFFVSKWSPLGD